MADKRIEKIHESDDDVTIPSQGWALADKPGLWFTPPTSFLTSAEMLKLPKQVPEIVVSQIALLKMHIFVSLITLEVGWLGTAYRNGRTITVNDVFLFTQDVSSGHTDLDHRTMGPVVEDLLTRPDGTEIFDNTRFWGHSHGNGGTYPSPQDDESMDKFKDFGASFFIRGIFNRVGDINFSVYDWEKGMAYHRVPWRMEEAVPIDEEEYAALRTEIEAEMLSKVTYTPPARLRYVYGSHVQSKKQPAQHMLPLWDPRRWWPES